MAQDFTFTDGAEASALSWGYGDLEGVQALLTMVTLTATSTPSTVTAARHSLSNKRVIDAMFDPDPRWTWDMFATHGYGWGWVTGDTGTLGAENVAADGAAIALMADAENLLTAASLLDTMLVTRDANAATSALPDTWRKQAHVLITKAVKRHRTAPTQQAAHRMHRRHS